MENNPRGGTVRALVRPGSVFQRCAGVPSIRSVSYGPDNRRNGTVVAVYGKILAGKGSVHGWIVHSWKKGCERWKKGCERGSGLQPK